MRSTFSKLLLISVLAVCLAGLYAADSRGIHSMPVRIQEKPKKSYSKLAGVARAHFQSLLQDDIYPDQDNIFMLTKLHMGEDQTQVELIIDSGSSVLWIPKEDCGSNHETGLAHDCDQAADPKSLYYLDGDIHGRRGQTTVWVNHKNARSPGHTFVVIDRKSELMNLGILGLSKGWESTPTFLETLETNKLIEDRAFSLYRDTDKYELILGGVDRTKVSENHVEATSDIVSTDSFMFKFQGARFGDLTFITEHSQALVDSGNTLICFPMKYSPSIMDYLSAKGFNCYLEQEANPMFHEIICHMNGRNRSEFPHLTFTIEEKEFTITGEHLIELCQENVQGYNPFSEDSTYQEDCLIRIEFQNRSSYLTLGKAFIERVYTTFDLETNKITFIQNL